MTVTLLLGDKNKEWCEDCWASYSRSNGGLTTALWPTSSWTPRRLSDSGPSAFKSFTVEIRGCQGSNPGGDKNSDKPWFHCRWCTESWSRNHRINHAEIPEPIEASTGRSLKPMDRTPRLWVRFPVGEVCHKHPGPDLVLTTETHKNG